MKYIVLALFVPLAAFTMLPMLAIEADILGWHNMAQTLGMAFFDVLAWFGGVK